jgi:hypothetical protein
MKTSDPGAYTHVETISAGSTILNIRAIMVVASTTLNCRIQGTSWEKDTNGNYKSVDFTIGLSTGSQLTVTLPIGLRTISAITPSTGTATVYGLR